MNVEIIETDNSKLFCKVKVGEVFICQINKTSFIKANGTSAINLVTGSYCDIDVKRMCIVAKKLIVEV